jgi:hypothetical protein
MRITHAFSQTQPEISSAVSRTSATHVLDIHDFAIESGNCTVLLICDKTMII